MNLFALSLKLHTGISVLTFELMSNHIHALFYGEDTDIRAWFKCFVKLLKHNLDHASDAIISLEGKCFPINNDDYLRNTLLYINRNGFVISPEESPFSYPWGANRYYFNPEAKLRFSVSKKVLKFREKRAMTRSALFDKAEGLFLVDGYISPMCFCDITAGESLFRNARQYFTKVSKNLESNKDIAAIIMESSYYIDDDLYAYLVAFCSKQYGCKNPTMLPAAEKIELAKKLHYDFNAGNKQIARMLKMDLSAVYSLFPL
ncbi:MAG: hypothetical protein MJY80_05085 [Bacteroidales bacterium]|nr:hypothetical protein [Bacteroidales bacterium]